MQGSAAVGIVCSVGVHIVQSVATFGAVHCEGAVATVHCGSDHCALYCTLWHCEGGYCAL